MYVRTKVTSMKMGFRHVQTRFDSVRVDRNECGGQVTVLWPARSRRCRRSPACSAPFEESSRFHPPERTKRVFTPRGGLLTWSILSDLGQSCRAYGGARTPLSSWAGELHPLRNPSDTGHQTRGTRLTRPAAKHPKRKSRV